MIEFGKSLNAICGSKNDLEEPESIKNFKLYSGIVMYESSLELVKLKETISGANFPVLVE